MSILFPDKSRKKLQNKIIDGGVADNEHKVIVPANTTVNLSAIDRSPGAIYYDTTANGLVFDNGSSLVTIDADGSAVQSFNGRTGVVTPQSGDYTKAQVGLSNVDNTSDANKPVSTATQTALNLKVNTSAVIDIAHGGTGQTSAANAINALLPTQTGHSGEFLTSNGSVASWASAGLQAPFSANPSASVAIWGTTALLSISGDNSDVSAVVGTPDDTAVASSTGTRSIAIGSGSITNSGSSGTIGNTWIQPGDNNGTGDGGSVYISAGNINNAASVAAGNLNLLGGSATAGTANGGDIIATSGNSAGGDRGLIQFKNGTEGTSGHVWTSTDTNGSGRWSQSGANRQLSNLSSVSINSDLLFGAAETYSVGNSSDQAFAINSANFLSSSEMNIATSSGSNMLITSDADLTINASGTLNIIPDLNLSGSINGPGGMNIFASGNLNLIPTGGNSLVVFEKIVPNSFGLDIGSTSFNFENLYIESIFGNTGTDPVTINSPLIVATAPTTASDAGLAGQIAYDSGFFYVCVADNTWKRVAIAAW